MIALLALVLVVIPVAEVWAIVWVAHQVGVLTMLALLFGVSLVGAILAKHAGLEVWRRFRATLAAGDIPAIAAAVTDGVVRYTRSRNTPAPKHALSPVRAHA